MNLIEALLGIAPDGGSGLLEIGVIVVALAAMAAAVLIRNIRSQARRPEGY
jgi:hypothetical protein